MQINVSEIEPCKLMIDYQADAEQISNKTAEIISAFKKAPVPGFRPGKASANAIRIHYRSQIDESLKRALAEEAFHNTLFEKHIKPHGTPRFNTLFLGDGKFNCEFEIHTKPNFELANFKGLEVPMPHETEDASIISEKMLQELRVRFGESIPYKDGDFVQIRDGIHISYEGCVDGRKVDSLVAENEMLIVGTSLLVNFDDNLLGMSIGETREFDLVAPSNGLPSLAGKTIHFKATLNSGSKIVPCPLDDSLAEKIGKNTFSELREFVLGSAQAQLSNKFKTAVNAAIAAKLVDDNNISVPNWMSLSEAQYLVHTIKLDWNTLLDVDKEKYIDIAQKNVKLSLILDKIRDSEPEAQLSEQEVFDIIKRNLASSKAAATLDSVIKEMNRTGYLQILFSRIRDEHTLDFVVKNIKMVE